MSNITPLLLSPKPSQRLNQYLYPQACQLSQLPLSIEHLNQLIAQEFHHRSVRDLAWALLTPGLFSQFPDTYTFNPQTPCIDNGKGCLTPTWQDSELIQWLYALDKHPEPLAEHLKDQRATRLGIYFEQLLSFYFSCYPRFSLLAKNLQANSEERTIGEYDFIVWDKHDQQHYHIEVAVKFYVGYPNLTFDIPKNIVMYNWHQWIGPNKKDSLSIKLNHLIQHQLRLSETDAGAAALATIGLTPQQLKPKLLLTGRLYLPYQELAYQSSSDKHGIDMPHYGHFQSPHRQYWQYRKALISLPDILNTDDRYTILPRQLWMSVVTQQEVENYDLPLLSSHDLLQQLTQDIENDAPLHIAQLRLESEDIGNEQRENEQKISEVQRFFVL
jgi:hypothetical protein